MQLFFALVCCLLLTVPTFVLSDVYLHNPRGNNDRNCEKGEERNNGNRLFDSENNAKGGYACPRAVGGPETVTPRMYYYGGSLLEIEWTNQHGCGQTGEDPDMNECDLIIQYMCEDTAPGIRDGTPQNDADAATDTIPEASTDPRYGQNEPYPFYLDCKTRARNGGLYFADQKPGHPSAISTRQNPNGERHGFECPEERDYYPYWHPTPWKDIAVLTSDPRRCGYYQAESQNVKAKGYCQYTNGPAKGTGPRAQSWYNNEHDCVYPDTERNDAQANQGQKWVMQPSYGIPPPECLAAPWSRVNHLGNIRQSNGEMMRYRWMIPNINADSCVVRLRYNISTGDFQQKDGVATPFVDARSNGNHAPLPQDPYVLVDNGPDANHNSDRYLSLAVDTDQFGRTFQDRSYVFSIRKRPTSLDMAEIYNLNVRGKRGNIVQTFPAVEYDFVPAHLEVDEGDYIHFQWTGSDYNPQRAPNDAEGAGPVDPIDGPNQAGRQDRSNIVEMHPLIKSTPMNYSQILAQTMFVNEDGDADEKKIRELALINQTDCLTLKELLLITDINTRERDPRNCAKLNGARTPYADGGLVQMRRPGTFHYMSTRNNHFSNRDQKGTIVVTKKGTIEILNHNFSVGWILFGVLIVALAAVGGFVAYRIFQRRKAAQRERQMAEQQSGLEDGLLR